MHEKERVRKVTQLAVRVGRFLWRRKRWGVALVVAAPLLTGMGLELFVLNLMGLGIGWLVVRNQLLRRRERREHLTWLQRRAEREEWEYQRWLKRREQEANQTTG